MDGTSRRDRRDGARDGPGFMLQSIAERLANTFLWIGVIASMAVASLGTLDAVASLLVSRPIPGVVEITELALVVIIFMSQPAIVLARAHIVLDLFNPGPSTFLYRLRGILTLFTGLLTYGLIAWTGSQAFVESWMVRMRTDGIVSIPVYPIKALLVVGSTGAIIVMLLMAVRHIAKTDDGTSPSGLDS